MKVVLCLGEGFSGLVFFDETCFLSQTTQQWFFLSLLKGKWVPTSVRNAGTGVSALLFLLLEAVNLFCCGKLPTSCTLRSSLND